MIWVNGSNLNFCSFTIFNGYSSIIYVIVFCWTVVVGKNDLSSDAFSYFFVGLMLDKENAFL